MNRQTIFESVHNFLATPKSIDRIEEHAHTFQIILQDTATLRFNPHFFLLLYTSKRDNPKRSPKGSRSTKISRHGRKSIGRAKHSGTRSNPKSSRESRKAAKRDRTGARTRRGKRILCRKKGEEKGNCCARNYPARDDNGPRNRWLDDTRLDLSWDATPFVSSFFFLLIAEESTRAKYGCSKNT